LALGPPTKGNGVGVALSVSPNAQRVKAGKVGRFVWKKQDANVVLAEIYHKDVADSLNQQIVPSEAKSGKLRLVRKGAMLHYSYAEGASDEFQELLVSQFGAEDIGEIFFVANNNTNLTPVDVRLLSLEIRRPEPPLAVFTPPAPESNSAPAPGRLQGLLVFLSLTFVIVLGAAGWYLWRRNSRPKRRQSHG
jgi:hypothetical protein